MTYIFMSTKLLFSLCLMFLLGAVGVQAAAVKAVFPPGVTPIGPYGPGIVETYRYYPAVGRGPGEPTEATRFRMGASVRVSRAGPSKGRRIYFNKVSARQRSNELAVEWFDRYLKNAPR